MKMRRFFSRLVAVTVTLSLICSVSLISVYGASGTKYEVESNDTFQTATRTLNEYDNYGTMSSTYDEDYWRITFASDGIANFWLGDIPSGCDYDMYVFVLYTGTTNPNLVCASINQSNAQEFLRVRVRPFNEAEYFIRIESYSSYDANVQYHFRIKNSPDLNAQYYSYTADKWGLYVDDLNISSYDDMIDTHEMGSTTRSILNSMDYNNSNLDMMNQSALTFTNNIPSADIVVIHSQGASGVVATPTNNIPAHLYANSSTITTSYDSSLNYLASNSLSNTSLVIYASPQSGVNDPIRGSLISRTVNKGAYNVIGWNNSYVSDDMGIWLEAFFNELSYSITLSLAAEAADLALYESGYGNEYIFGWTCGSSSYMDNTVLY